MKKIITAVSIALLLGGFVSARVEEILDIEIVDSVSVACGKYQCVHKVEKVHDSALNATCYVYVGYGISCVKNP